MELTQDQFLLTTVFGVVSALLTALVAHIHAPAQIKALILLVFSLASGATEQAAQSHGPFTWHGFLTATTIAFIAGVTAHKGALLAFLTGPDGLIAKYVPGGLGAALAGMPGTASVTTSPAIVASVTVAAPVAVQQAAADVTPGGVVSAAAPTGPASGP
jgi:hypothetical protein